MLIFIDNYDSFTFNLVHYFGVHFQELKVIRNDHLSVDEILALEPKAIILGPGPCTPNEAGVTLELIQKASDINLPLLGVCLGHQAIGMAFGADVVLAPTPMHGKMGVINHIGTGLFEELPNDLKATRYHSLTIKPDSLPDTLISNAHIKNENIIMGIHHKTKPIHGVQFHPESIATEYGHEMISNFAKIVEKHYV